MDEEGISAKDPDIVNEEEEEFDDEIGGRKEPLLLTLSNKGKTSLF